MAATGSGFRRATGTDLFGLAGILLRDRERQFTLFFEHSYFDYALERISRCALLGESV